MLEVKDVGGSLSRVSEAKVEAPRNDRAPSSEAPKGKSPFTADVFEAASGAGPAKAAEAERKADAAAPKSPVDDPNLCLSKDQKAKLQDALDGKYSQDVAHQTRSLLENLKSSPPEAQAAIAQRVADAPAKELPEAIASANRLVASPTYRALPPAQKTQVAHVVKATGNQAGLSDVEKLVTTQPTKLNDCDKDGKTLLANLDRLATQGLNAAFAKQPGSYPKASIVDAAVKDVVTPGKMIQSDKNTCNAADLQYELAARTPSEYVRLLAGMTGPSGKASMRGGGELELLTSYLKNDPGDERSPTDALMQNAITQHITGHYDPHADLSPAVKIGPIEIAPIHGYATSAAVGTMGELFGRSYIKGGAGDAFIAWDPKIANQATPDFIRNLDPSKGPVIVDAMLDGMGGSHALDILRIEKDPGGDPHKDRVVFRNPWGPCDPKNPPGNSGQVVDAANGIYSMTVDEMAQRTQSWAIPVDPIYYYPPIIP